MRNRTSGVLILMLAGGVCLAGCNRSQARTDPAGATATTASTMAAVQAGPATVSTAMPASDPCPSIGTLAESKGGRIALGGARVVRLSAVCGAGDMTAHLRGFGQGMRYLLVADDLRAGVQPGVLFRLSLGPPSTSEAAVLGTLSFFSAQRPGAGGAPHSLSFDVTREVQAMAVSGWPANGLGVALSPSGPPAPGADASIGAIRLVAQAGR